MKKLSPFVLTVVPFIQLCGFLMEKYDVLVALHIAVAEADHSLKSEASSKQHDFSKRYAGW